MANFNRHPDDASFVKFIQPQANHRILGREEEADLIRRTQSGDAAAYKKLCRHNIRMMLKQSYKYQPRALARNIGLGELFGVVGEGFHRAVEGFDLSRQLRLSTYASYWILAKVNRYLRDHADEVRLPVHLQDKLAEVERFRQAYQAQHNRPPEDDEICQAVDINKAALRAVLHAPTPNHRSSLDDGFRSQGGERLEFANVVADLNAVSPDVTTETNRLNAALAAAKASVLDERERLVLYCRIDKDRTLEETADELALYDGVRVTRERIRQIEFAAHQKIRKSLEAAGYRR